MRVETMAPERHIEVLVRGVCVIDNRILLCRNRKVGNVYLPGGHVEFGESGALALAREIAEEMGREARVMDFMGCAEHCFTQAGEPHAEINLIYRMEVVGLVADMPPESCEDWIEFFWQEVGALPESAMEPAALRSLLREWLRGGGTFLATTAGMD